jgi:flagellar biosynthetic protein FliP
MKKKLIFISSLFVYALLIPLSSFASQNKGLLDIIGGGGGISSQAVNIFLIITVLGLAPSILVMMTSFVRIVIVLSMVRSAIGLQQSPPNQVMISLSLFLTFFIMSPVLENSYYNGVVPLTEKKITEEEAFPRIVEPFKKFMTANTRKKDIDLFIGIAKIEQPEHLEDLPIQVVIPSFMISELRRAFEIGFLLFLPFIIIDIVVSSVLMAMGMMMMPPVMISMPFKIIFFVIIDGWNVLVGSLIKSFVF